jgi:hypothetical protein
VVIRNDLQHGISGFEGIAFGPGAATAEKNRERKTPKNKESFAAIRHPKCFCLLNLSRNGLEDALFRYSDAVQRPAECAKARNARTLLGACPEFVVGGTLVPTLVLRQANIKETPAEMDLVLWALLSKLLLVLPVSPRSFNDKLKLVICKA